MDEDLQEKIEKAATFVLDVGCSVMARLNSFSTHFLAVSQ
jgi:hypothetical protein